MEVNRLMNNDEARRVRDLASGIPSNHGSFYRFGRTKRQRIVVPFTLPDGSLPQNEKQAELFHAHAYRRAAAYYKEQLQKHVEIKKPDLQRGCRLSVDPSLYYNPLAVSIQMKQPLQLPIEVTYGNRKQGNRSVAAYDARTGTKPHHLLLFESCLKDAMETTRGITANDKDPRSPFLSGWPKTVFARPYPKRMSSSGRLSIPLLTASTPSCVPRFAQPTR